MNIRFLPFLCVFGMLPALAQADDARCAVWQRELAFAQSVRQHDEAAFASHIEAAAVFGANTPHPLRGRTAIVAEWRPILAGKHAHLSWYPTQVAVGGSDGDVAYSSGPWLLENTDAGAKSRYLRGHFATVWHRDRNGSWRVMFDAGDEGKPSDAAGAAAFERERPRVCPCRRTRLISRSVPLRSASCAPAPMRAR